MVQKYLEDLNKRIDPSKETALRKQWQDFADKNFAGKIFVPDRGYTAKAGLEWPWVSTNSTLDSYEKMAYHQLRGCSQTLENESSGSLLMVRCNYGVGILPSLFGTPIHIMDEKLDSLPTSLPLESDEKIREIVEAGMPDLMNGLGRKVFEMGQYYHDAFADFPNVRDHVSVQHPDLQGPMDIAELIWGSTLFTQIYLDPELLHALLNVITDTYIAFMNKWFELFPPTDSYYPQWGWLHKGRVMIRDDSAMNLSGDMYEEFIKPYNQRIFDELGGGSIHFCGKGDHYIENLSSLRGLYAIQLSQPHLNDMETIYTNTVDKGIAMIGHNPDAAKKVISKRGLHGLVHAACWGR